MINIFIRVITSKRGQNFHQAKNSYLMLRFSWDYYIILLVDYIYIMSSDNLR